MIYLAIYTSSGDVQEYSYIQCTLFVHTCTDMQKYKVLGDAGEEGGGVF
jgi:hypothetical protein